MRGILMLKKIENLPVMKQQSQNELFHRLDKAPRTPLNVKDIGVGEAPLSKVKTENIICLFPASPNRCLSIRDG